MSVHRRMLMTWMTLAVTVVATAAVTLPGSGPRVALCLRGRVRVDDGVSPVVLSSGQAGFAPAGRAALAVSGDGELFQASART